MLVAIPLPWIQLVRCSRCTHLRLFHVDAQPLPSQANNRSAIDHTKNKPPPRPAEDHAGRWPSGSLSAHVEEAIWLLEQNRMYMKESGVSQEQLENMRDSLERMKKELDLLGKATEMVRKGVRKTKRILSVRRGESISSGLRTL